MRLKHAVVQVPAYWRESRGIDRERSPLPRRVRDVAAGYHPLEADWYRQIHGSSDGFITNFDREHRLAAVNGTDGYLVDSKYVLTQLLTAWGLPVPKLLALGGSGGWAYPSGDRGAVERALKEDGKLVVKPVRGRKGQGFGVVRSAEEFEASARPGMMATPFMRNAPYAEEVHAGSLNTIRILMLRSRQGLPFVAAAMHRFGSSATGLVDNFSAGGVVAKVDLHSGRLDRAVLIDPANRLSFTDRHPETNAVIEGRTVEDWQSVLRLVEQLGQALPCLRYVGWDIAVTPEGPVVIEGNSHPSLRFFQFYGRLDDDEACRDYFAQFIPHLR